MAILVFNPGSNSLKFAWIEPRKEGGAIGGDTLLRGVVEPIDSTATISIEGNDAKQPISIESYGDAARVIVSRAETQLGKPARIACRVVHGGGRCISPTIVDEKVLADIEQLEDIAPLHNASSVAVIRGCISTSAKPCQ
jgi:acetate kinase